jgi:hypothetical protein
MGGQHRVVRLYNSGRNLGRGGHRKGELGLASIVNRESLKEERSETGSSTSSGGVEDEETLKAGTVVSQLTDPVKDEVNNLLSNGVVTTGVVVSSILLSTNNLLRVVQLTVRSRPHFVTNGGFKIDVNGTGDVLSSTSFGEEGVEGIITTSHGLVSGHLTIRLNAVLETVKFPAAVTGLDTGLAHMDGDTFCEIRRRGGDQVRGASRRQRHFFFKRQLENRGVDWKRMKYFLLFIISHSSRE